MKTSQDSIDLYIKRQIVTKTSSRPVQTIQSYRQYSLQEHTLLISL